uniref:Uncharacterized protein n=1 Tax=Timema monikensis TaxID=170555 RepID=A0A7R9HTK8_9NEOP|nr:unnamed protein product [Timema monikensis]
MERQQKDQTKLDWFALADSKDCVRVDKNGHGLQRLWRQQLCQFNLATLETAEAISSKYQCPQALIQVLSTIKSFLSSDALSSSSESFECNEVPSPVKLISSTDILEFIRNRPYRTRT